MSLCVFKDTFALIGDGNGDGNGRNGTGTGEQGTQDAGRRQAGSRIDAGRQVLQEIAKKSDRGRQNAPPPFEK